MAYRVFQKFVDTFFIQVNYSSLRIQCQWKFSSFILFPLTSTSTLLRNRRWRRLHDRQFVSPVKTCDTWAMLTRSFPVLLKGAEIRDTKTLNLSLNTVSLQVLVDVSRFSPGVINLIRNKNICCRLKRVVAKSRARVYFEQPILVLLLVLHQTHNLSRNKSTNQRAAFIQPSTNAFVAGQVDRARWKTGNIDENLQRNSVVRQVKGFCISYFAAFSKLGWGGGG